ncbi:MAG: DNA polymerase III subunit beta [Patescibacteria group bacterium]
MKFKILQGNLKDGVSITSRIATKSVSLPILKNIHLETKDSFLCLSSTDLEVAVKWWALTKVEEEGKTTIPLDVFSSFINLLPKEEKVNIKSEDNNINVECEDYNTEIKGLDAEDFPIIPKVEEDKEIKIKTDSFLEGLKQVVDVPSNTKVKPEISGVYFHFAGKTLKLAATDSYRLAEKIIFLEDKVEDEFSFILPQKAAKELLNIFANEEEIKVKFDSNQVLFESQMEEADHPRVQLTSKLIEGEYPNYQAIIPEKSNTEILLDKEEFLNKIKAASLFSGKVNEVTLSIKADSDEMNIVSEDNDLGNYKTNINGKTDGEDVDISFNHRFLKDGLSQIKSSEIVLSVNNESSPGKITPVGNDDFLYVVMPIKNN